MNQEDAVCSFVPPFLLERLVRMHTEEQEHIVGGFDHLLFLAGLLLGRGRLVKATHQQLADELGSSAPRIIDASTAHRVNPAWVYGFPEMAAGQLEKVKSAKRADGYYSFHARGTLGRPDFEPAPNAGGSMPGGSK